MEAREYRVCAEFTPALKALVESRIGKLNDAPLFGRLAGSWLLHSVEICAQGQVYTFLAYRGVQDVISGRYYHLTPEQFNHGDMSVIPGILDASALEQADTPVVVIKT